MPAGVDIIDDDGTRARVICGEFWGKRGPVEGVAADPRYLDVFVPPGNANDPTRSPTFYDSTFNYLRELGIPELA